MAMPSCRKSRGNRKVSTRRWVQELGHRPADDDPRRRYYRLTSLGSSVLAAETARLADVVREARMRLRTLTPRRS